MILIVDDESFALSLMLRKLSKYDFHLLTTTSVKSAIFIIESQPALKLVITDLHMPEADGFELLAWLKKNRPGIATIVTTAHGREAELEIEQHQYRCDKLLIKPIDVDTELFPAIHSLIGIPL